MPLPIYPSQNSNSPPSNKIGAVIAIAAGKGGVGKSTVAVHLAVSLKAHGFKVGILDADLYGPSIRKMLPEDEMPSQNGTLFQPALSSGIKVISMAYFRKTEEAAIMRAPIANAFISNFIAGVNWGNLDYLIVDFPPGTGDIHLTLAQKMQLAGAVIVTTPQEIALQDVRKAISLFNQVKIPILGIVENMSFFQSSVENEKVYLFGKGGGEKLAKDFGVPLLGQVPLDPFICESGDKGKPAALPVFDHIAIQVSSLLFTNASDPFLVTNIVQKDKHTFRIDWNDGLVQDFRLCDLQRMCPCANCTDEVTGKSKIDPQSISDDVKAIGIHSVGRYGLKIDYVSGCSSGIYSFEKLRRGW